MKRPPQSKPLSSDTLETVWVALRVRILNLWTARRVNPVRNRAEILCCLHALREIERVRFGSLHLVERRAA